MEWVEVHGRTIEGCTEEALKELGVERDRVEIEVVQEPKPGFLGIGGRDAIVKVSVAPPKKRRRRRRRKRGGDGDDGAEARGSRDGGRGGDKKASSDRGRGGNDRKSDDRKKDDRRKDDRKKDGGRDRTRRAEKPAPAGGNGRGNGRKSEGSSMNDTADIAEQEQVAKEFLVGLVGAFGLEGTVETRVEDDILYMDLTGGQTEALVGPKGSVMQSVLELTRTVVQRKTHGAPRMRIDIAGYNERRREALKIYAGKLADEVLEHGGEIMLEPMNPADRKVVHDAVADIDDVRSFSEGEDPNRSVVIALADGVAPRRSTSDEE